MTSEMQDLLNQIGGFVIDEFKSAAIECLAEYDHGCAEFHDCEGVTRDQYKAVVEDFFLYLQGSLEIKYRIDNPEGFENLWPNENEPDDVRLMAGDKELGK